MYYYLTYPYVHAPSCCQRSVLAAAMLPLRITPSPPLSPNSSASIYPSANSIGGGRRRRNIRNSVGGSGKEDEPTQFEIDPESAREALKKLDQQFQSLSQKSKPPVKFRKKEEDPTNPPPTSSSSSSSSSYIDSDVGMRRRIGREEDMPELSGSFLGYSAVALLAITFITNILFIVFVKPAFDGY